MVSVLLHILVKLLIKFAGSYLGLKTLNLREHFRLVLLKVGPVQFTRLDVIVQLTHLVGVEPDFTLDSLQFVGILLLLVTDVIDLLVNRLNLVLTVVLTFPQSLDLTIDIPPLLF